MGDPITATLAAVAVSGGLQAREARKARKQAQAAADKQIKAGEKLEAEEAKKETQSRSRIVKRRGAVSGELRRRADVKTGPLGLTTAPQTAEKTILGA